MKIVRRLLFATVASMLLASAASAQNASIVGALELYPTIQAIGARLVYTGDANGNATARLEWRVQGGATWIPGVAMTRITGNRWAGSVLWLNADTPYEVRATIDDPDGGGNVTGTKRTRSDIVPAVTGRAWWVATNGNDSNTGTSTFPLATLQAAADRAAGGDEIRVRPGLYYQTVHVTRAGLAGKPIHLVGDAPGVILDGSDPAHLRRTDWRDDTGGVFSIPFTAAARLVCADSLQRLYHHANLAALRADANGVAQGYAVEGGRLYVKLEDRTSPVNHVLNVARYENALFLEAGYWRIAGLQIRNYGLTTAGAGIYVRASSNNVISDNTIYNIGGRGIFLRVGSADNLMERNTVLDPRVGLWPWSATKAHEEEITAISNRGGRGNVMRTNIVRGWFDGLDVNDGTTDENVAADADITNNMVTNVADDGIETDTVSGINVRVMNNVFDRCYYGISVAPNYQGPEYILYNTITNTSHGGFKFSISGTGQTWICHNTVASDVAGSPAVHPTGPYSNIHFRNNILVGNGAASVSDDAGESQTGNDFNGDLIHSNYPALFRWKNTNYSTIAALRTATGFELNGRSGDPWFVSALLGDYTLQAISPAIDGALRLPGINDRYAGVAPDIGAFEFGAVELDVTPPAPIRDLEVEPR